MTSTPEVRTTAPAQRLRTILQSSTLGTGIGAHTPLSARLGEESGFDAIWASGLEISAAAGVPDANILSMSEVLAATAAMADAVSLPVLADCDSGFGNVNNVVNMVQLYERRGIAGVCLEDKLYPKLNSFAGGQQDLAPIHDFAGKIRAARDTRESMVIVARLEALIAGQGLDEALLRADVYEAAGADALLIHSKKTDPDEVFAFRERYRGELPVIVVPTTYNRVTTTELQERGFAFTIYANHALRSSITAMRDVLKRIRADGTSAKVEHDIVSVAEVFKLQGMARMLEQQAGYEAEGRSLVTPMVELIA
jgi:phosphoenolpyruvate phosphomutase